MDIIDETLREKINLTLTFEELHRIWLLLTEAARISHQKYVEYADETGEYKDLETLANKVAEILGGTYTE